MAPDGGGDDQLDELYLDDGPICQLDGMDDSFLDDIEDDVASLPEVNKHDGTKINIINTNARSLCPKIDSLIDCFEELDVTLGVVTETWLADGESLDRDVRDLAKGAGLGMVCLNRRANDRGVAHGGVAVIHNTAACTLTRLELPNPEGFEVLITLSCLPGHARKLLTVACYLPPNYPVQKGKEALDHIENVVLELKRRYRDPFILVPVTSINGRSRMPCRNSLTSVKNRSGLPGTITALTGFLPTLGDPLSSLALSRRSNLNLDTPDPVATTRLRLPEQTCQGTGPSSGYHTNTDTSTRKQWKSLGYGWRGRTGRMW